MKVAILFEMSGRVRDAFIKEGHDAMSCDLLDTLIPGNHIKGNVFDYDWSGYDLIIAHPPCTHIAVSGNAHYAGTKKRQEAAELIHKVWNIPCKRLCIENPVGQINKYIPDMPKPQYIQPWMFGEDASKKPGLWKRGLPDLIPTNVIIKDRYENQTKSGQNRLAPSEDRAMLRSLTYYGIADAMAKTWGIK